MTGRVDERPIVVLVPGLWVPAWGMLPLAWHLQRRGLRCVRFGYPWISGTLDENARRLGTFIAALDRPQVDLVGYSLGGVLALHATVSLGLRQVRRMVLIGSPYRGSHVVQRLARWRLARRLLGRTLPDWLARTKPHAPPGVDVGVIAGTVGFGLGVMLVPDLPRPHDGVICVRETGVPGMADGVQLRAHHSRLLISVRVAHLVRRFLCEGRFATGAGESAVAAAPGGTSGGGAGA